MRPLKKFKKDNNFTYRQLQDFLQKGGINVALRTVIYWCLDEKKNKRTPRKEQIPKLSKITGYEQSVFILDCFYSEVSGLEESASAG